MADTIRINKNGSNPTIEVIIGQANWGTYRVKLWDKDGLNPKIVGQGFSGDLIDDEHEIGDVADLKGRTLTFKVRTASLDPSDNDTYNISVLIKQDGRTLNGGLFLYSGPLSAAQPIKTVGDFVKFSVA